MNENAVNIRTHSHNYDHFSVKLPLKNQRTLFLAMPLKSIVSAVLKGNLSPENFLYDVQQ